MLCMSVILELDGLQGRSRHKLLIQTPHSPLKARKVVCLLCTAGTHSLMLLVQLTALISPSAPLLFKLLDPLKAAAQADTPSASMLLAACRPVETVCECKNEVLGQCK